MLICDKCGGRLKVTNTLNRPRENEIVRRLKCLRCGGVSWSIEGVVDYSYIERWCKYGDSNNGTGAGEDEAAES